MQQETSESKITFSEGGHPSKQINQPSERAWKNRSTNESSPRSSRLLNHQPLPPLILFTPLSPSFDESKIDDLFACFSSLRNFRPRGFKSVRSFIATLKGEAISVLSFLASINGRDEKFANFPRRPSFPPPNRGYFSREIIENLWTGKGV